MVTSWLPLLLSFCAAALLLAAVGPRRAPAESTGVCTGRRCRIPVGGVAMAAGVLVAAGCVGRADSDSALLIFPLVALACVAWALGLLEDMVSLPWWGRDAGLVLASAAAYSAGATIEFVKLPFAAQFHALEAPVAGLVTVLWLMVVTRSFLATRSVSGLTVALGGVAALALGVVALLQPQVHAGVAAALAFSVGGACLAVQMLSRFCGAPPVGVAGSALIGFLIGVVTILGALKNTAFLIVVLPLLVLSAPLLNTTYAFSVAAGASGRRRLAVTHRRECLHEVLLRRGVAPAKVVAWFTAIDVYLCLLALLLVRLIKVHYCLKAGLLLALVLIGYLFFLSVAKVLSRQEPAPHPDEVRLFDVRLTPVTMDEALTRIEEFIRSRQPHHVVTSDSSAIVKAQTDLELHEIMNEAHLVTPDGIGVIWSARLLDVPVFERVSGVDLVARLAERGAAAGYRFFLLGAAPGVAETAAERLRERFPGLQVVGTNDGYFSAAEETPLVERIRESNADILLVAFGVPKQEKWIRRHLAQLKVPVCIGVGGTFDVYSGRLKRAPVWVQCCGLEWLYRALIEPSRFRRLLAIPQFMAMTFRQRLRSWKL
ncbi:MAG: hypothetical protein COZ06_28210 [Armatimonadetes bacterium CG_4_10_14_3_um_filter_66_18]|nr:WecB/TagA/CpsF family glycosyltransferase [Armatimonadota bacterium]PIY40428.1 MAG: hypothetical protein COZ06_28210 [Armatimonadetes bacterium CG_4_10_14_3_um_filter_66_18]